MAMSKPERVYEMRKVATGWLHYCENPTCDRVGRFFSKREARFCSTGCRQIEHTRENRRAREIVRAQASADQPESK